MHENLTVRSDGGAESAGRSLGSGALVPGTTQTWVVLSASLSINRVSIILFRRSLIEGRISLLWLVF